MRKEKKDVPSDGCLSRKYLSFTNGRGNNETNAKAKWIRA